MVNVHGQHFDIMKEGHHKLLNIPRGASPKSAKLLVAAECTRFGGRSCGDLYFTAINVTGAWVRARGGLRFHTHPSRRGSGNEKDNKFRVWHDLGQVDLKVVEGTTNEGSRYLNLYVRKLAHVKAMIGGLLGGDDHTEASTAPAGCQKSITL